MAETNGHANAVTNGSVTYAEAHNLPSHFIGGNKLENAPASKVKEFVASHNGHTVITNVSVFDTPRLGALDFFQAPS